MAPITGVFLHALLASTALAAPQLKHTHHKHHGTGTGTGGGSYPTNGVIYGDHNYTASFNHTHHHHKPSGSGACIYPTGGASYGHQNHSCHHNHTRAHGTGTGNAPIYWSTVMVSPLPTSTSLAAAATVADTNDNVDDTSTTTCGPGTVFVTASNTITVTIEEDSSTAAAAASSTVVDSSSPSSTYGTANTWTSPLVSPGSISGSTAAPAAALSSSSSSSTIAALPASTPTAHSAPADPSTATSTSTSTSVAAYTPPPSSVTPTPTTLAVTTAAPAKAAAPVAAAPVASSPAASSAAAAPATPNGTKRGLVYNTASLCAPFATAAPWAYNWDSKSAGLSTSIEYVPMLWGLSGQQDDFVANTKAAIAAGSKYVLGFNEPDETSNNGGSQLDPQTAATGWQTYMTQFRTGGVQLGSPAVTNANSTSPLMGIPWLQAFDKACAGACPYDFVNLHWYGWEGGTVDEQVAAFKTYINAAKQELGNQPIWVTEFSALPIYDQTINSAFMSDALLFLDGPDSGVERYSYFMVNSQGIAEGQPMGNSYLS